MSRLKEVLKKKEENEKKYQGECLVPSVNGHVCITVIPFLPRVSGTTKYHCRTARQGADCTQGEV